MTSDKELLTSHVSVGEQLQENNKELRTLLSIAAACHAGYSLRMTTKEMKAKKNRINYLLTKAMDLLGAE